MLKVDSQLLEECKKGDRRAHNKLYELCFSILLSICLRYERNQEDAKHMLNLGFLKIVTNLNKYSKEVEFEYWIRRIMINTNIDEYRKKKRSQEIFTDGDPDVQINMSKSYNVNEGKEKMDAEELEMMIRSLPHDMQKVFNLFAIDGYSHKDIADMMKIPEGTSKWLVSSARDRLKKMIETKNYLPKASVL